MKKKALLFLLILLSLSSCLRVVTHSPIHLEEDVKEEIIETGQVSETLCITSNCFEDFVNLTLEIEQSHEKKCVVKYNRIEYTEKEMGINGDFGIWVGLSFFTLGIPIVITIFQYPFIAIMAIDEKKDLGRFSRSLSHPPRIETSSVSTGTIKITDFNEISFKPNSSGIFSIPIVNLDPWQSNFDVEYHEPSGKIYHSQFSFNWYEFSKETLIKTGDEAFDKKEFYKAAGFYQKAGHQEKASLALVKAGEKALKEKDFSNATNYFEKAGQTERAKEIYILQGEEALKNKNFDTAINYFKQAHVKDKIKKAYEAKLNSKGIEKVFGDTIEAWGNLIWGMDINDAEGVLRSEGFDTPPKDTQLDFSSQFQSILEKQQKQLNPKAEKLPEKKIVLKKGNLEITCYFFELEPGYWPLYQISLIYDESRITGAKILDGRGSKKYLNLEFLEKLQTQYGKPTLLDSKTYRDFSQGETHEFEIKSYQWDDKFSSIELNVSYMKRGSQHLSGKFDPGIYYTNNALWDFCNPNPENKPVVQEEKEEPLYYKKKEKPYKEKWERDLDRKLEEIQRKFERDMEKTMRDLERSFR